jgi:dihydrofolate reductase
MAKLVVTNHITLDGVMQAPGGRDEDTRGGFEHGGWAAAYTDEVMGRFMGERITQGGSLLFGRLTYEKMFSFWPKQTDDNPFTPLMNERQKYVASTTMSEPLAWQNSTLLDGDVPAKVAALKEQETGGNIAILGSGALVQSLLPHGLIDQFVLTIHPLVLGSGRRLFADDGTTARLKLVHSEPTTTGVLIAVYEPVSS